jgi:hypothetical protein
MGNGAGKFAGKMKRFRRFVTPTDYRVRCGEGVKRGIPLNRVENRGVLPQKIGGTRRDVEESASPVAIAPERTTQIILLNAHKNTPPTKEGYWAWPSESSRT